MLLHHGIRLDQGARITDFRGDAWEFLAIEREPSAGRSGKLRVRPWLDGREPDGTALDVMPRTFYVGAFPHVEFGGLYVDAVEDDTLPCGCASGSCYCDGETS